jgi:hypothetical protein
MIKYRYILAVSAIIFATVTTIFFLDYRFSSLEKVLFAFLITITISYALYLKNSSEILVKRLLKAEKISKIGFWSLDFSDDKLFWAAEIYEIFEIDAMKFKPSYESFLNTIHPEDREMVDQAYTTSLQTRENYTVEHRLLMSDGRVSG